MAATDRPYADNRKVLTPYSKSMVHLLKTGKYNSGKRPSEHHIGEKSFLTRNEGAIPPNVLTITNTGSGDKMCIRDSPTLKPCSFSCSLQVEPGDFTQDLQNRLRTLYAQ